MKLFGWEIKRGEDEQQLPSFIEDNKDEGAINVGNAMGGAYGMLLDMEGTARSESEIVTRYRSMLQAAEIHTAVDEIVNEAISVDSHERVVEVVLDDLEVSDSLKTKIRDEFDNVLTLLDFSNNAYEIMFKFYMDGRIHYHVMIDDDKLKEGIQELRYIDPRKIKLIREIDETKTDKGSGMPLKRTKNEYFMYSETGFGTTNSNNGGNYGTQGYRIAKDSIARVTSGIMNENNTLVLSHLHKAIKPMNQLKMLEDATVIYTMTRAPERRVFYIDVGRLPKSKAEQYLTDMMARHKNKVNYNANTGELGDQRKMMTMTEDYWFPRREGNRTTEIDTLPSAGQLLDNEQLTYFQRKLYKSLNVPVSRLEPESMYSFGRVSEMTRDEIKFAKFIRRLRARFSILFDQLLEKQLVLKGIISPEEWKDIKDKIRYDFMTENYFEELKKLEINRERWNALRDASDYVGIYYSKKWVRKNILFMNEDEIENMEKEIEEEKEESGDDEEDTRGGFGF